MKLHLYTYNPNVYTLWAAKKRGRLYLTVNRANLSRTLYFYIILIVINVVFIPSKTAHIILNVFARCLISGKLQFERS